MEPLSSAGHMIAKAIAWLADYWWTFPIVLTASCLGGIFMAACFSAGEYPDPRCGDD